jgi:serine/threonine-protein kinase
VPAGSVIRQDPPAGEKVAKGSAVSIVVSSGSPSPSPTTSPSPGEVAVPNVYGMQSAAAAAEVGAAGLEVSFKQKAGTGQEPGTVVNIVPDAGTVVPAGSAVTLVIAK